MKTTHDLQELEFHAETLAEFIMKQARSGLPCGELISTVYVKDAEGREFTRVLLEVETLTDGSKVSNLILLE